MGSRKRKQDRALPTRVIHGGQQPDPLTGAVMPPVYLTSTYRQPAPDGTWPWTYARSVHPTREALEKSLADLEGGRAAFAFASGMAAIDAVVRTVEAGERIVASRDIYGGTYRLLEGLTVRAGVEVAWVDTSDVQRVADALDRKTRLLLVETPTNPTLKLSDIEALAGLLHGRRCRLAVDNTFLTPCFQRPLELGADLVIHSTTKYLNGHSDSIGGAVVCRRRGDAERIGWIQRSAGAILAPLDSYLVLRGIKTLALRMERHAANAARVARWLEGRPSVARVFYPGLPGHPQGSLARRQMQGNGGIVTIDLGSARAARRFMRRLKLWTLAESLGGVESLVAYPATMTHGSMPDELREAIGVGRGLVRLSVGIEAIDDLLDDLEWALA